MEYLSICLCHLWFLSSVSYNFLLSPWVYTVFFVSLSEVKVAQSCLIICNPMVYTVHGILQARTQEWAAIPFSRGSSWPRHRTWVSRTAGRLCTIWFTTVSVPNRALHKLSSLYRHRHLQYLESYKVHGCYPISDLKPLSELVLASLASVSWLF